MLAPLLERLLRSRSRARIGLALRLTARAAVAVGVVQLGLVLTERIWDPPWFPSPTWLLLALLVWLALDVPRAVRRAPGVLELARAADRRFGLNERVSTAIELSSSVVPGGAHDELVAAQLADAARHARRIEPRTLVPIPFPRSAWAFLAVVVLLAGAQFLPATRSTASAAAESQQLAPEVREEIVHDLKRAAELLDLDAERNRDPYVRALAQAFEDLARRAEAGLVDDVELQQETAQLTEHAERIYGEGVAAARDNREPAPGGSEGGAEVRDEEPGAEVPPGEAAAHRASETRADGSRRLSELVGDLEAVEARWQERRGGQRQLTRAEVAEFGPYVDAAMVEVLRELQRQRQEARQEQRAGQPAGAAQEANEGPGDAAGVGEQPLGSEEGDELPQVEGRTEDLLLPGEGREGGDRIRTELPPEARLAEVADEVRAAGSWEPGREAELRRDLLAPHHRTIVSRYFDRRDDDVQ
jgi:hypothetical protein